MQKHNFAVSRENLTMAHANNKGVGPPAHMRSLISCTFPGEFDSWMCQMPKFKILATVVRNVCSWAWLIKTCLYGHTGQCKRTGRCYNELVVAFFSTGGGVKGKKIYTCWLYDLFINLHLFYLWWHLAHRPPVTLQFMALPIKWWFNSWFGLQIQQSSGVLPWQVLFF